MVNFSTNQVMQFYVLDGDYEVKPSITGDYAVVTFTHDDGEVVNTDRIENVMYGKYTGFDALGIRRQGAGVYLNPAINGGAPVAGQVYTIRVKYPEIGGLGVEGWTTKTASITATSEIADALTLYEKLADLLNIAFGEDGVTAYGEEEGVWVESDILTDYYKRGVRPLTVIPVEVSFPEIMVNGEYVQPFIKEIYQADSISGTYKLADMEYFAMGERGDQYRYVDYLNAIDTKYRVQLGEDYDMLVVHYAYKGTNQNSHKSEKDLIVVSTDSVTLKKLAKDLEEFAGITFTFVESYTSKEVALPASE